MKEKLLTIQEAAKILKVSTKTLRRWDESGKFSPERTAGNQRRYRLSQVMELSKPQRKAKKDTIKSVHPIMATPVNEEAAVETEAASPVQQEIPVAEEKVEASAPVVEVQDTAAPLSIFDQIKADREKALSAPLVREEQPFVPVQAEMPVSSSVWPKASAPVDMPKEENREDKKITKYIIMSRSVPFRHVFIASVIAAFLLTTSVMAGYAYRTNTKKSEFSVGATRGVLSAQDVVPNYILKVNVPGVFGKKVTFLDDAAIKKSLEVSGVSNLNGGIETHGANINAGKGKVTASNLVYSIVAGSNITVSGDPQNPTVAADLTGIQGLIKPGVTSLQGQKGDVTFTAGKGMKVDGTEITNDGVLSLQGQKGEVAFTGGSGVSLNGLEIVNTGVLSVQGQKGEVAFTAGPGITIDGMTISSVAQKAFNSFSVGGTTISPDSSEDTFTFVAGSGLSITPDTAGKSITIDVEGIPGQWSTDGLNNIYYSIGNVGIGTSSPAYPLDVTGDARITGNLTVGGISFGSSIPNGVLHAVGGTLTSAPVQLGSEVTGTLSVANGGTGLNTSPASGQILLGNGTGYTLGTIVGGTGVTVSTGANTISVTNNGVLSLTGTANQVYTSGATGAITLSLPQNIHTGAAPTFASLNLSTNTNQLTLGTGNQGIVTLGTLTSGRTYTLPDASGEVCLSSGNCIGGGTGGILGSGTTGYIPRFTAPDTIGTSSIYDTGTKVGIGTTSPTGLFSVSGTATSGALMTLNETGGQNILTGSASGATRFVFDNAGNLGIFGGVYMIDGVQVLSSTALGDTVTASQLQSVGALTDGSIAPGFGSIETNSTIQGSTITATSTTGFVSQGVGGGLTFYGTGNHIISASQGTLQIGAATLGGTLNANSNDISNIQNLSASGTLTLSGYTQNGGILYTNSTGQVQQTAAGTDGQLLIGQTGGAPLYRTITGDVQISNAGIVTIQNNAVALGTDTVGNYISDISGGSGIAVTGAAGEGWTPSIALGNLSEDWVQSSANDIVLANAGSELRVMESTGNTYYGTIDMGDLDSNKTYTFPNVTGSTATVCLQELGNCAGGASTAQWVRNGTVLSPLNASDQVVLGGNTTTNAQFEVTGARTANPLVLFNETGDQNILVGQASGANRFVFDRSGNLNVTGVYQIGGTTVLSANQLGTNVTTSSLTSVGALSSGSIGGSFGSIVISDTIQGSSLISSGVGGISTTAANAGLTFGSTGTHVISAAAGSTLQINAFSLGGDITGNNYSISGLTNLEATGTITTGLTSGIVKSNNGVLETGAVNLNSTETTGVLPVSKGGTGQNFSSAQTGSLLFFSAPGVMGTVTPSTDGYVLTTHGAGVAPTWESTSTLGTNYWNRDEANGTLSSKTLTDDLLIGGADSATAKLVIDGATGALTTQGALTFDTTGVVQTTGGTLTIGSATTGSITLNPTNGGGTVNSTGNINLSAGKAYYIGNSQVLSSSTLGGSVKSSSLESVGPLSSGSIADGFGPIYTSDTIRGTDITAAGSTGFTASGTNAGLSFSGTGTHIIGAAAGSTLQVNAFSLGGNITGSNYSITGLTNLEALGTITTGLTSGIVKSNAGVLESGAVNLNSTETSGVLPVAKGGTGKNTAGAAGTLLYSDGTNLQNTTVGQPTQVLISNGSSAPGWVDASTVGTNYWNEMNGGLSPKQTTESLYVGGNSTASAKLSVNGVTGALASADAISAAGAISSASTVTGTQLVSTVADGTAPLTVTSTSLVSHLNADLLDSQEGSFYRNASNINAGTLGYNYGGTGATTIGTAGSVAYSTGSAYAFSAAGTAGQVLVSGGGSAPTWVDPTTFGTNYWNQVSGGLSPKELTESLYVGGSSTASAKLSVNGVTGALTTAGSMTSASTVTGTQLVSTVADGTAPLTVTSRSLVTNLNADLLDSQEGSFYRNASNINAGTLGFAYGGTGATTIGTAGSVAYSTGSAYAFSTAGIAGQVLLSGGGSTPTWADASTVGTNYWYDMNGGLSPKQVTESLYIGGTSTASAKLSVNGVTGALATAGSISAAGAINGSSTVTGTQLVSTVADGTAPLTVTSRTLVSNLNSDYLDGQHGAFYQNASNINAGTLDSARLTGSYTGITGVGTIGTGTWQGTAVGTQYGGTGANLSAATRGSVFFMNASGVFQALAPDSAGKVLQTNGVGADPTWVTASGLGTNYWTEANGGLSPNTLTNDLFIGGNSSASAKLQIDGATGDIFSNNNIVLNPNSGSSRVQVKGLTNCNTIDTDANGTLVCGTDDGGSGSGSSINVQNNGSAIGLVDTINFSSDFLAQTGPSTTANVSIADNALNFSELSNSLSLDAATGIALGNYDFTIGNGSGTGGLNVNVNGGGDAALIINKTGTGDLLTASSGGTTRFTVSNTGAITTGTWNGTAISALYGGTGLTSAGAAGAVYYSNGTSFANTAVGTSGYILRSNGSAAPTWVDPTTLGTNYWTRDASGALYANTVTDDLWIGGNTVGSAKLTIDGATGALVTSGGISATGAISSSSTITGTTLVSSVGNGTAPLTVSSNTLVSNLNADLLDGQTGSFYQNATNINAGTLAVARGGTGATSVGVNGSIAYSTGSVYSFSAQGTAGQVLLSGGAGVPTWTDAANVGTNYWNEANGGLSPKQLTESLYVGGNSTASAMLSVNGITGNLISNANLTGVQLVSTTTIGAPLSVSSTSLVTNLNTDFLDGQHGAFYQNANNINAGTLGIGYGGTGATSVGANGSIVYINGGAYAFSSGSTGQVMLSGGTGTPTWVDAGSVGTNYWNEVNGGLSPKQLTESLYIGGNSTASAKLSVNGVTGSLTMAGGISAGGDISTTGAITSSGTVTGTNLVVNGNNASLSFSGTGTHTISGSNLQIDAFAMGGDITGGNHSITGLNNLTAIGTITTGLTTGIVKSNAGVLETGAVNLNSTETSGILPVTKGGTGQNFSLGTAGALLYFSSVGTMGTVPIGGDGQVLTVNGSTPSWQNANILGVNYWNEANGGLSPKQLTESLYVGGNSTASAKLSINGVNGSILTEGGITFDNVQGNIQTTGNNYLVLGGSTTGDIYLDPSNGAGSVQVQGDMNLYPDKAYKIDNITVLDKTSLGLTVLGSHLQTVGELTGGSIGSTFGTISTNDSIAGSTIIAKGTDGFVASASGARLTFTGGGINTISSTNGGTLELGAFTLGGEITGNDTYSISGVKDLTASGTIIFSGLGNGFVKNTASGLDIVNAINLSNGDVTGTLPISHGGTGRTTIGPQGSILYSDGTAYQFTASGSANKILSYNATTNQPEWTDAASVGTNFWQKNGSDLSPSTVGDNLVLGGTILANSKFAIVGATGNATTSGTFTFNGPGSLQTTNFNDLTVGGTTTGNITLSPKNGDGTVLSTANMNLAVGKVYQIDGKTVLTGTSLGSDVVSSLLTSVGVLSGGSIGGSFGDIQTTHLIQGNNFVATGGGFSSSADEADLTFSGAGNHTISVSNGTLQLGAVQLIGNINGNGYDLTSLKNLSTTGSVQFSGLTGTGTVIKVDGSGNLSKGSIALGTDVSGMLPLANGGTGADLSGTGDGRLFYKSGTSLVALSAGNSGQVLQSTGDGTAPQWTSANALGTNYWQEVNNGLAPLNVNDNLYVGGNSTASAKLTIEALTGKIGFGGAGTILATGDISLDPNAGTGRVNSSGSINVATGKEYMIGGSSVLSSTTLANSVINSNLSKVGNLSSGSIDIGFSTINTNSAISGSTLTSKTGGFISEGAGAGLTFNGNNDHLISAGGGTLKLGAVTLAGTMSAALNDITQVRNFDTTGAVTFTGLAGTGNILKIDGSGSLSKGKVDLASSNDLTGILPMSMGGTGAALSGSQGMVPFVTSAGVLGLTGVGSNGQVLMSQGAGADVVWANAAGLGTNYWQSNQGVLAPKNVWESLAIGGSATASAKFSVDGMTGNVTSVGNLTLNGGSIQTGSTATDLTLGGANTGNIILTPNSGTGSVTITGLGTGSIVRNTSGILSSGSVNLNSSDTSGILPINKGGLGADFSGKPRGTIFFVDQTGAIKDLAPGTDGNVLITRSTTADPEWTSSSSLGTNFWQRNAEGLAPLSIADNLLIGGAGLSTAKFSVLGANGNASMSGTLTMVNGSIQTVNNNVLTLGGGQTGNIVLSPAATTGTVSIVGLGTGIVKSTGGILGIGTVDLAGSEVSNLLPITKGGTGADLSSAATGSLFVKSSGGALVALGQGADGQILRSNGIGTNPGWTDSTSVGTNFWQRNGEDLAPNTVTNNLLIGANTLTTSKFAVLGATGTASTSGNLSFRGVNSQINLLNSAALGFFNSAAGDAGLSSNPALYINPQGQIGMGTNTFTNSTVSLQVANASAADQTPLVVFGDAGSATRFQFLAGQTNGGVLSMTGTRSSIRSTGDLYMQSGGANDRMIVTSAGNVGIGTSAPTSLLDVAGAASISGSLTFHAGAGSIQTTANSLLTLGGAESGGVGLYGFGSCTKLYTDGGVIKCGSDAGGSGTAGTIYVKNNGGANIGTDVNTLNFINDLVASASPTNQANISIAPNSVNFAKIVDSPTLDNNLTNNLGTYNYIFGTGTDSGNVQINLNTSSAALSIANAGAGALISAPNKFVVSNGGSIGIAGGQSIDTLTAGVLNIGTTTQNALTVGRTGAATTIYGSTLDLSTTGAINLKPGGTTALSLDASGNATVGNGGANNLTLNSTIYKNGSSGCAMLSTNGSGVLQCSPLPTGVNYWQVTDGALSPYSNALDFLVGSTATASAKFAVSNGADSVTAAVKGSTTNAAMTIDNAGTGDLLRVTQNGAARFTINNAGDLSINGTTRISNGGVGTFTTGTTIANIGFNGNTMAATSGVLNIAAAAGANALTLQSGTATGDINFFNTNNRITSGGDWYVGNNLTVNTFNNALATNPANTLLIPNTSAIASSPISPFLWHDLLAFNKVTTPTFETSTNQGGTWTAGTLNSVLFNQKEAQQITVLDGTTTNGARWTWHDSYLGWSQGEWMVLGFTYTGTAASKSIVVQTSADGSTWTTRHSSSGVTANSGPIWLKVSNYSGDSYIRLSITVNNGQPVPMSTIRLLTSRWGDQGQGSELSYPYEWDTNQNMAIGAGAAVANGVLTLGTNTTAATGGMYFGTDTNLYRSAADTLRTDDTFSANNLQSSNSLTLGGVTNCNFLNTNSTGVVGCGTAPTAVNYWQLNAGAIAPLDVNNDLLIGSNATASAKFAVSNGGTNPTVNINGTTAKAALVANNNGTGDLFTASTGATTRFTITNSGNVNITGLTGARAVFTDANKNLVTSAASSSLLNALTDETGTGVAVFSTSPTLTTPSVTTSLQTGSTSFDLVNTTATTVNFAGAATALTMGASGGTLTVGNGGVYTITTGSNDNLTIAPNGTGSLILGGSSNTNIRLAKSTLANCTALYTDASGNISCSTVPLSANLWARSGTNLSPATAGDSVYLSGSSKLGVNVDPATMTSGIASFNGNVGIGVTSPSYMLDVSGSTNPLARFKSTGATAATLQLDNSQAGVGSFLRLSDNADEKWQAGMIGGTDFILNRVVSSTPTTALQISNTANKLYLYPAGSGQVGINNNNPQSALDVSGDIRATNSLTFTSNGTVTATGGIAIKPNGSAGITGIGIASNGDITLGGTKYTAGCERLYTDATTGALQCGAQSAGGISSVTDGTTTVNSATSLAFSNLFTVAGTSPNPTVTIRNDSLNFAQLATSLTLDDADTSIALGNYKLTLGNGTGIGNVNVNASGGGNAALIVNKQAVTGDIFTASASGATKFIISNAGDVTAAGTVSGTQLISTIANGTAPLVVTSSTAVTNLNADMLDGQHASAFAPATGGGYLAKNAADTSTAAITAGNYLYALSNSSSAVASGVLSLNNASNTGNALSIIASGNPGAGNALIYAANTNASPTGNLIDLRSGATPTTKFSVDDAGNVTTTGTINNATISGGTLSGGTVSGGTLTAAAVNGLNVSGTAITGTGALAINANGSNTISIGGTSTGNIDLGGGSGNTGCTLTNSTGAFACSGAITGSNLSGTHSGTSSGTNTGDLTLAGTGTYLSLAGQALTVNAIDLGSANVAGTLPLTRGGTGASLTASNGGIVWTNGTQMQVLSGTGTANQCLLSGANTTPSWGTCALGTNLWQLSSNVVNPINAAYDFAVGGTTLAGAELGVAGNTTTANVVTVNAASSGTALNVNQTSSGNLLNLSKSGTSEFTVKNDGTIVLGTESTATQANTNVTVKGGTVTASNTSGGNITFDAAMGTGLAKSGDFIFRTAAQTGGTSNTIAATSGTDWQGVNGATTTINNSPHTIAAGNHKLLVAVITAYTSTATITSLNWNTNEAMTQLAYYRHPSNGLTTYIWYKVAPTVTSANVSGTFSASVTGYDIGITSYSETDQSTNPFDSNTLTSASGFINTTNAAQINNTVPNTTTGQAVIDVMSHNMDYAVTPDTGTSNQTRTTFSNAAMGQATGYKAALATATPMNWDIAGGNTRYWLWMGVAIKPYQNPGNIGSLTERMRVTADGTVGIGGGTYDTTNALDVNGNVELSLASTGTYAVCHSGTNGVEANAVLTDCSGTPADYAEAYATASDVEYGDLVKIGDKVIYAKATDGNGQLLNDGSTVEERQAVKTTQAYDPHVLGIVSNNYSDFTSTGHDRINPADHPMPVALSGRVPVKIASSSAEIHAGDVLAASDEPGKVMKATRPGQAIGKALEDWSPTSGKATVLTFVNNFYYDPDVYLTDTGDINVVADQQSPDLPTTYTLKNSKEEVLSRVGVFSDMAVGNAKVGSMSAQKLVLGGRDVEERLSALESLNGSGAAQLTGRVQTLEEKMVSLQDKVASMEASMHLMMTGSTLNGGFTASSAAALSIDQLEVNDANISGNLAVAGRTTVADLGVTGKVTAGLLSLNGLDESTSGGQAFASINTSVGPLKIQSDAINNVDFMNGKVVFETNGNMRTEGEITVKKINIHTKDVAGASIGNAVLPAGDTSIVIDTSSVTDNSNIFITPKSRIKLPLSVTEQTAGQSFKVEIDAPLTADVKFSWWIVN